MAGTDISTDLAKAQEKLSDVMTALNREEIVLGAKQMHIQELTKEESILQDRVATLQEQVASVAANLAESQKQYNADIEELRLQKNTLLDEVVYVEGKSKAAQKSLEDAEYTTTTLRDKHKKETEKEEERSAEVLSKLHVDKDLLSDDIRVLKDEKTALLSSNKLLYDQAESLEDSCSASKAELDLLKESIIEVEKTKENLERSTQVHVQQLKDLESEISQIHIDNQKLSQEKNLLQNEITTLEKDRDDFVKAKIQLQRDIEAYNQREAVLKEQFERAGVQYP